MSGWFKVHRGWMQSPDFQAEPFTEREAFLWSIEQAAHSPHIQFFNGVEIAVERGEFATSSRKMAAAFQWGDKRTRLFIARMQRRGKWAQRAAQQGAHIATILTVCNYGRFQGSDDAEGAPTGAARGAARAQLGRSEGAQQKKGKNGKKGKNEGEEASPPSLALVPVQPIDDAVAAYIQAARLKKWPVPTLPLSDERRKGFGRILKLHGLNVFVATLQRAVDSDLLGNGDPPQWFNVDFVIHPKKFLKLKEGSYDRQFSNSASGSATGKGSEWAAACGEALAG